MKGVTFFSTFVFVAIFCHSVSSYAQSSSNGGLNTYTGGVSYALAALNAVYDGRASALGGSSVATMADAASPYLNPAKLPFHTRKFGGALSFSPLLFDVVGFDIYVGTFQGFYNFGKTNQNSVFAGFQFLSYNQVSATSEGQSIASYTPTQMSGFLGYARRFGRFGVSAGFQLASQTLIPPNLQTFSPNANFSSNALAISGNLGLFYSSGDRESLLRGIVDRPIVNAGFRLKNIGPKVEYSSVSAFQPASFALGGGLVHTAGDALILQETIEINKLLVPIIPAGTPATQYFGQSLFESYGKAITEFQTMTYSLGVEAYVIPARIFVRAGAMYGNYLYSQSGGFTFTGGLGYKYNDFGFNLAYSYSPWSVSPSSLFFTVFWDTGGYLPQEETFDVFDLDFFSVEDLFPELE